MTLPASGAIDFGQIQTEFGGSNPISMNEYGDKIGLTVGTTSAHSISDFYGLSAFSFGTMFDLPNNAMVESGGTSSGTAMSLAYIAFAYQPADNRIRIKQGTGTNSTAVTFTYYNVSYSGADPTDIQVKQTWSGSTTGSGSSEEPPGVTSGSWYTMAKQTSSSDTGSFSARSWTVEKTSGVGAFSYDAGSLSGTGMVTTFRALDASGNVIATSSNSNTEAVYVLAEAVAVAEVWVVHNIIL